MSDERDELLTPMEVQRVLRRSSELEQGEHGDLSVGEVLQAAREAGLEEAATQAAIAEVLGARGRGGLGLVPQTSTSARLQARGMSQEEPMLIALADAVRRAAGPAGALVREGTTLRWGDAAGTVVLVQPNPSRTDITVTAQLRQRAQSTAAVSSALVGVGAVFLARLAGVPPEHSLPLVGALAAGGLVGHGLWRVYWRRFLGRWRRRVHELAQRIAAEVEALERR